MERQWTVLVNGKIPDLIGTVRFFETRTGCNHYIKTTFPPSLRKLGNIKAGKVKVTIL